MVKYLLMTSSVAVVPGAARAGEGRRGLVGKAVRAREEHAVQEGQQRPGGRGVVHRRADDEAVSRGEGLYGLVHAVVYDAAAGLGAAAAGPAARKRTGAEVDELRLHAAFGERARDLVERRPCAAVFVRAAVYEQNFHFIKPP